MAPDLRRRPRPRSSCSPVSARCSPLGTGNENSAKSSSAGSAATAQAPHGDLGNLGDVSQPAAIRALLRPATQTTPATPSGRTAKDSTGSGAFSQRSDAASPQDIAPIDPRVCAGRLAGARPVRFFGTGTYQGRPVTIIGIDSGGRTIAFVVPSNNCTNVLTSISR